MCYASSDDGYFPVGQGSEWFTKWMVVPAPESGWKIHVSCFPDDAARVAASVLPELRELRISHKVVRDRARYEAFCETRQAGKFITIYARTHIEAQAAVDRIDPGLLALDIQRRPVVMAFADSTQPEVVVGQSRLLSTRPFD